MFKLLVFLSVLLVVVQSKVFDPVPSCIEDDDVIGIDGSIRRKRAADNKLDRQAEQDWSSVHEECLLRVLEIPKA